MSFETHRKIKYAIRVCAQRQRSPWSSGTVAMLERSRRQQRVCSAAAASGLPGSPLTPEEPEERAAVLRDSAYRLLVQLDPLNRDLTSLTHAAREAWKAEVRARFARQHPDVPAARAAATPAHQLVTFLQPRPLPPSDRYMSTVGGRLLRLRGGRLLGETGTAVEPNEPIVPEEGVVVQVEYSPHGLLVRMRDGGVWGTMNPPTLSCNRWDWASLTVSRFALGEGGSAAGAVDVLAVRRSAYALDASGRIWGWGMQESTFLGLGNDDSGEPAFAHPTPVTVVWLDNNYVPAPAFARISGNQSMLCAVARDGTLYACGCTISPVGRNYNNGRILARLPDPPALVRDIVANLSPGSYHLYTNGHRVVDIRTDQQYSEESQMRFEDCVVRYRPSLSVGIGMGTGPLALLVDGSLFSLTAQARVDLGGRVAVGLSVVYTPYLDAVRVHFWGGTARVLIGLRESRPDELHPGDVWVAAVWRT